MININKKKEMENSLEIDLIKSIKSLNYEKFKVLYQKHEKEYGFLEFCVYSELLTVYKKRKKKINDFVLFMKDEDVYIDGNIVNFNGNEVFEFYNIFEKIGLDFQNFETGNTLIHSIVIGKNYKALEFYINSDIDIFLDIENNNNLKPIDILFLENNLFDKDFIKKAALLLNKKTENNFSKKNNTLYKLLEKQVLNVQKLDFEIIDLLIKSFELNKLHLILNINLLINSNNDLDNKDFFLINCLKYHYNIS